MQGEAKPNVQLRFDRLLLFKISNRGNGSEKTYPTFQNQLGELMGVRSNESLTLNLTQVS